MKPLRYRTGRIVKTAYSTYQVSVQIHGTRYRESLKSLDLAKARIDELLTQHYTPKVLSPPDYAAAIRAREMLPPDVGIDEAARYWMAQNADTVYIAPLDALRAYTDERTGLLAERSVLGAHARVRRFLTDTGGELNEITRQTITAYLKAKCRTNTSWMNYRAAIHHFLEWCRAHRYVTANACAEVARPKKEEPKREFWNAAQVQTWLDWNREHYPETALYYALGFFAGVRSQELARMDISQVTPEGIIVNAADSKTARRRYIEPMPCLRDWVAIHPAGSPLLPGGSEKVLRKRRAAACAALGVTWPANVARHSFVTHFIALTGDYVRCGQIVGDHSPHLLERHYRGTATAAEAEAYFAVVPR